MVFPVCYSDRHFVNTLPVMITNILVENRKRKEIEIIEHLPVFSISDTQDSHHTIGGGVR